MPELKAPLKGFLQEVGPLEEFGVNKTLKQRITLFVPGWVNEFGEKKGKDNQWDIDIFGADAIDRHNVQDRHVGAKVEVEVYIASTYYQSQSSGWTGCIVNVNLKSFKVLEAAPEKGAPVEVQIKPSGEDDDLPF
jgi:hypothetical protein